MINRNSSQSTTKNLFIFLMTWSNVATYFMALGERSKRAALYWLSTGPLSFTSSYNPFSFYLKGSVDQCEDAHCSKNDIVHFRNLWPPIRTASSAIGGPFSYHLREPYLILRSCFGRLGSWRTILFIGFVDQTLNQLSFTRRWYCSARFATLRSYI